MFQRQWDPPLSQVLAILPMFPRTAPLGKCWEKPFPRYRFLPIELDEHCLRMDGGQRVSDALSRTLQKR